LWVK